MVVKPNAPLQTPLGQEEVTCIHLQPHELVLEKGGGVAEAEEEYHLSEVVEVEVSGGVNTLFHVRVLVLDGRKHPHHFLHHLLQHPFSRHPHREHGVKDPVQK